MVNLKSDIITQPNVDNAIQKNQEEQCSVAVITNCFMWLENQIPGMNLQMSILAKVDDIMIKIADYSVKWSNVCCIFFLNSITNYKTFPLIYYGSHLRGHLGLIFFTLMSLNFIYI